MSALLKIMVPKIVWCSAIEEPLWVAWRIFKLNALPRTIFLSQEPLFSKVCVEFGSTQRPLQFKGLSSKRTDLKNALGLTRQEQLPDKSSEVKSGGRGWEMREMRGFCCWRCPQILLEGRKEGAVRDERRGKKERRGAALIDRHIWPYLSSLPLPQSFNLSSASFSEQPDCREKGQNGGSTGIFWALRRFRAMCQLPAKDWTHPEPHYHSLAAVRHLAGPTDTGVCVCTEDSTLALLGPTLNTEDLQ